MSDADDGQHEHEHHAHEHEHEGSPRRRSKRERRSVGGWISNWNDYDAPTGTKLALAARNLFVNRWKRSLLCCGHPGQPGC